MRLTGVVLAQYFKRYIERELYKGRVHKQWHPLRGWVQRKQTRFHYEEFRPWEDGFKQQNPLGKRAKFIPVQPIKEWSIFKGDRVQILVGKDAGKQGIINSIIKERNWVYVEGLNCDFEEVQHHPDAMPGCHRKQRPLLVTTQVKLVDPADSQPTDIEWRYTEEGDQVRVAVNSGRIIPLPTGHTETEGDMVVPSLYTECDKDTRKKEVHEVTFKPRLTSFQQDIMDAMGIKETRQPAKTYWY